jgi:GNAT superfamily N-acetyltransferase
VAVYGLKHDLREHFIAAVGSEELAELAVLFVASDVIGRGVGGRLLDTAVDWIVASGRQPVLDVVPVHARAVEVYQHRGWEVVGEVRPVWLAEDFPTLTLMTLRPR